MNVCVCVCVCGSYLPDNYALREYDPETLLSTSCSQTTDSSFGATLVNTNTCEKISIQVQF